MTRSATHAIDAWQLAHRRRARAAASDRVADGVVACGGIVLTNAALSLGIGLPAGRAGMSLGASLLAAGIAWILRRSARQRQPGAWIPEPALRTTRADASRAA